MGYSINTQAYDELDLRYMSSSELQEVNDSYTPRPKKTISKPKSVKRKVVRSKSKRPQKVKRKVATKTTKKPVKKKVPVKKKKVVKKVVQDPMEILDENLPKEREEINKTLDAIEHVRTFYRISRGANISDLQDDNRFKEIYTSMKAPTKRAFYYYLKGVYLNSAQAIKDQQESGESRPLAELKLNRNYSPTDTDIDGFNEKSAIKSKLVRNLKGSYFRRSSPAITEVPAGTEIPAGSEESSSVQ